MKFYILSAAVVFTTLFFKSPECYSQDTKNLYLIPTPQKVELTEGGFVFSKEMGITISSPNSSEDKFSAEQLSFTIKEELGLNVAVTNRTGKILLGCTGKSKLMDDLLNKEKITLPNETGDEGYVLKITPSKIIIAANSPEGVFYGVQTLKQIIKANRNGNSVPCLTIYDWPALKLRGWMDDISRGPIPTMDFLKNEIRTMAEYKHNYFTLYTEHVFKLKKYPDIAPRDGISAEEIAELTEYAEKYHIELVGNAQSFGHMANTLRMPFYSKLRETVDVLNPSIEATYNFLGDMYSEIAPAYKSKLFNINCDETDGLGSGGSKILVDGIGLDGVYAYHINRINNLLKKYDKRLMMWGDIAVNNKGIIDKLPKDLIILSWGYHAADSFDDAILPFKNSGFEFMVAPGVSCWSQVWPDMANAAINISNYVRDGYKLGAMGMMNTAWDDDGENLFNYNWYSLIWGAECSWKPASAKTGIEAVNERNERLSRFNPAFDKLFFGCKNSSVVKVLYGFNEIRKVPVKNIVADGSVWESMLNLYPDNLTDAAIENNKKVLEMSKKMCADIELLRKDVTRNNYLLDHAAFAAKRVMFTAEKNLIRADVSHYMKNRTDEKKKELKLSLAKLNDELFSHKKEYVHLWNEENRGWWLDKVLDKYNKLGEQILNLDKNVFINLTTHEGNKKSIELSTLYNDKDIYYSANGETPTLRSDRYTTPIELTGSTLLRARIIENKEKYAVNEKYFFHHKAIGRLFKLNSAYSKYNPAYSGGGDNALVDGVTGSDNFADGCWQGYQGQDLDLILDLGSRTDIKKFNISCIQNSYSWILMPSKVQLYSSDDGISFALLKEIENNVDPKKEGAIISNFKADFNNVSLRYLKVICKYPGDLPAWHHAAGNQAFIFADEIVVE
jgi:hexosaminidase